MAYLVNQARIASLTINGVNYTSSLVSWQVSDASAYKNGLVSTAGSLVLAQPAGAVYIEDYERDNFKRGQQVILDITYPDGTTSRHPRGLLYVISTSYNVESGEISVEIGCRLALAAVTEKIDDLLALAPIPLDEAQKTYSNISASIASAGKYAYQDNLGNIVIEKYFNGDSFNGTATGAWISILGYTALKVEPLASSGMIPDEINLTYNIKSGDNTDDQGKVIEDITQDEYWIKYPAVVYERQNTSGDVPVSSATTAPSTGTDTSGCGNTPAEPNDQLVACSDGYQTVQTDITLPAKRISYSKQVYDGPAAQVSYQYEDIKGPALEANTQYYSDWYAYCRQTWATKCNPNGNCPLKGTSEITLSKSETFNTFSADGRLVKTVKEDWATKLSAAQPFNWRSGNTNGQITSFTTIDPTEMYKAQAVVTEYVESSETYSQTITTTYTSIGSEGVGLGDAAPNLSTDVRTGNVSGIGGVTEAPGLPDGSIQQLATTTSGAGNGLTVDITASGSGKVLKVTTAIVTALTYNPTLIGQVNYWEEVVEVSTANTSGTGLKLKVKYAPIQVAPYTKIWTVTGIAEQGSGYNPDEDVVINATALQRAGAPWVTGGTLTIEIQSVTAGSIRMYPAYPGGGYAVGDVITVSAAAIQSRGYPYVTKPVKAKVSETTDGYATNSASLDAYSGIRTRQIRTSKTITAQPINPDTLNSPQTSTEEKSTKLPLFSGRYVVPPNEASTYTLDDSIMVPLLLDSESEIQSIVDEYSDYIVRFTKGSALGLTIGEALRKDIVTTWKPNTPFRYYDSANNRLIAMRMDGTTWGVTQGETGIVTRGIWVGVSNGTVPLPSNLEGDSRPDMGAGTTPPVPVVPPTVSGETSVSSGALAWNIDIVFSTSIEASYLIQVPYESTQILNIYDTAAYSISGYIVTPGSLLSTEPNGSIPLEYNGSLLVQSATIIDGDLFN